MLHQAYFDVKCGLLPFSAGAKAIADFPKPAIRGEMMKTSRRMTELRTYRTFAATAKSDALEVQRRHEGREAVIRCGHEPNGRMSQKQTFSRQRTRVFVLGSAEYTKALTKL